MKAITLSSDRVKADTDAVAHLRGESKLIADEANQGVPVLLVLAFIVTVTVAVAL